MKKHLIKTPLTLKDLGYIEFYTQRIESIFKYGNTSSNRGENGCDFLSENYLLNKIAPSNESVNLRHWRMLGLPFKRNGSELIYNKYEVLKEIDSFKPILYPNKMVFKIAKPLPLPLTSDFKKIGKSNKGFQKYLIEIPSFNPDCQIIDCKGSFTISIETPFYSNIHATENTAILFRVKPAGVISFCKILSYNLKINFQDVANAEYYLVSFDESLLFAQKRVTKKKRL